MRRTPTDSSILKNNIILNERIKSEKYGWYLKKNMDNGLVFGSIIKDENDKEMCK